MRPSWTEFLIAVLLVLVAAAAIAAAVDFFVHGILSHEIAGP